jgi:lysozyme
MSINVVVDLSHFNTVESFATVKAAGIVGVIHKATQGTGWTDPTYHERRTQALAAGLWWGAYHFGQGGDGVAQAEHFLSFVNPGPNDLLALDFETNPQGASMTLAEAEQFVTEVQSKTKRWPGFYGGGGYLDGLIGSSHNPTLANCWFWLSDYQSTPHVPANWPTWTMWQYTGDGLGPEPHTVEGIEGNIDRDQFNGDMDALTRLWGYAPSAVETTNG